MQSETQQYHNAARTTRTRGNVLPLFPQSMWYALDSAAESIPGYVRTELVRKSIHMLVALVPSIAAFAGAPVALGLLGGGTLLYAVAETSRLGGHDVYVISDLTLLAARRRDRNRFVMGPITLGLGAMLALLLYPDPAATIAIYALAFGDGVSSLVGKIAGRHRIPGLGGKTAEGSIACFAAVFAVSSGLVTRPSEALTIAVVATLLEALPIRDLDNLLLPIGTGFVAGMLIL